MDQDQVIKEVTLLLRGDQAHVSFTRAVRDFPEDQRGERPCDLPYSAWQLVEHIRIAQRDILDWCRNTDGQYKHRKWPEQYWPHDPQPPSAAAWTETLATIERETGEMCELVRTGDLTAPLPWSEGHTLLREAMLLADHNAYHTSEIVVLRRLLGCWK